MAGTARWEEAGNKHLNLLEKFRPRPYHRVVARLAAKYSPENAEVLDLGCGLGQVSFLLKRERASCALYVADAYQECLDITAEHVEVTQSYIMDESGLNLEPITSDHEAFDVVVMSHLLEHMLDPVGAVKSVMSLLKPGGHLILAVPNPARPTVLLSNVFRKHYVNRGHVAAWDRSHWINFLEGILGLEVVEYASDSVVLTPTKVLHALPFLEWFETGLARVFPWWSFSNIAVVRRSTDA